jgi:hypothetical protein
MTHQHFMELSNRWFTPISRRVSQSTTTAMSYATPYATTRTIHTYIHHAPNNPSLLFTHKIPSLKPYIHPSQHHFNTALSHPTSKPKRARTHGAPMSHTNRKLSSHTHHRRYHHYQQHTQPQHRHIISQDEVDELLSWLPLPPNPMQPGWHGRCLRCFVHGHSMNTAAVS